MIKLWIRSPDGANTSSTWCVEEIDIGQNVFDGEAVPLRDSSVDDDFVEDGCFIGLREIESLRIARVERRSGGEYLLRDVDDRSDSTRASVYVDGALLDRGYRMLVYEGNIIRFNAWTLRVGRPRLPLLPTRLEQNFLAADVRDEETRAVYADWLEENGRIAKASFLRLSSRIEHASGDDDPALARLTAELRAVSRDIDDEWRWRVSRPVIEACTATDPNNDELRFTVSCPKKWEALTPIADREHERHCDACKKTVTYCTSMDQARSLAWNGGCVAIDPSVDRKPRDLSEQELKLRHTMMGQVIRLPRNVKI